MAGPDWYKAALRAIAGPCDESPWIEVYRDAGGGYEGLQAMARFALEAEEQYEKWCADNRL